MTEDNKKIDVKQDWVIGMDDMNDPSTMTFSIPFRKWANDDRNGKMMIAGFFDFAKQLTLQNVLVFQQNKNKVGVILPNGKPG